jgi:folate-dependent phosphoribosylglycinamide formyltransferase PurN
VDSGYILAAEEVPVLDGDSEEDLQERVKKVEQILYPEVLDRLAAGAFSV